MFGYWEVRYGGWETRGNRVSFGERAKYTHSDRDAFMISITVKSGTKYPYKTNKTKPNISTCHTCSNISILISNVKRNTSGALSVYESVSLLLLPEFTSPEMPKISPSHKKKLYDCL